MNGLLNEGTILVSESSVNYKVISFIGAGGQGEVYDVEANGKHYALKWYFKNMATQMQKNVIDNLIKRGAPNDTFLWPQDMIFSEIGESFGYIMPLRPKRYKSIVDLMKRRAEPSFYTLCKAAYNLTNGYRQLHNMGYSYRDISFGNVFFDPDTGDVLICDNDNVTANGIDNSTVYGTPRFMAPEIVIGAAKPSRNTDLYSLAVLLFYILMLGHPLEGRLEANIKCMDINAMNLLYGSNPVFIFDPENKTNRPVAGYQDNVLIYWDLYPSAIKKLFVESFTVGLKSPNKRITEKQWLDVFANMLTGIIRCPKCGAEVFFDIDKFQEQSVHTCWHDGAVVPVPAFIQTEKNIILLHENAHLFSHHINRDYDMETVYGSVIKNPMNPSLWGIKNEGNDNWTYVKADGTQLPVPTQKSATIAKNIKINFGKITGEIKVK